jgi:hypothetical protein
MLLARRSVALLAAYLIALQILLLPLGVAAGPVASEAHCTADRPVQHHTQGCPCAAGCGTGCCEQVLAEPPAGLAIVRSVFVLPPPLPLPALVAVHPVSQATQTARAPPAAERI